MGLIKKIRHSSDNTKIVIKNIIGAFVVKGGGMIVSLITTPLFIVHFILVLKL